MKHSLTLFLFLTALLCASPSNAQRKRHRTTKARTTARKTNPSPATAKPAVLSTEEAAQQALDAYDVDRAEAILQKEIETLRKKKQLTTHLEQLLEAAHSIAAKLHATERIIIVDSLVCPKEEAIRAILLSRESGRVDTYASTYHTTDKLGATLYENELANRRYLAVPKKSGSTSLRLAVSDKIGDQWSEPHQLIGLDSRDLAQNFPFLLSDGVTLYYAATGPESMGGYDIFVTRSDGEDGSFLTPENIGFPFNSTANDYLLAIDEFNQLGWFISDRRQPKGKVCVYTFIPNETRQLYGDDLSEQQLRARARITAIRDTWNTQATTARQRLQALRDSKQSEGQPVEDTFQFIIDDQRTYTRLNDFRSSVAREKMKQYTALLKTTHTDATMLQRLRDNYAAAGTDQRRQLTASIQRLEATHYPQLQQLQQLAKDIRNAEITHQ